MIIYAHDKLLFAALSARLKHKSCRVIKEFTENADIAVAGENSLNLAFDAGILLVNSQKLPVISGGGRVGSIVSCGMSEKDTVTFSSIDKECAALCVQRNINTLESGEFPVNYDENLSIYHNLAIAFCETIIKEIP